MLGLISSIVAHLREYAGKQHHGVRRHSRYAASLPFSLAVDHAKAGGREITLTRPSIVGHTRDLTRTGLSLIVPSIRIGGSYLTDRNNRLRITLELPSGPVEMLTASVRFEQPANGSVARGYLLGVRIIKMNKEDRACYLEYLSAFVPIEKRSRQVQEHRRACSGYGSPADWLRRASKGRQRFNDAA